MLFAATKTAYGAYTVIVRSGVFWDEEETKEFWKDGRCVMIITYDKQKHYYPRPRCKYQPLFRSQGYKYWKKYFPNRACYTLPEILQEAIDREPRTEGRFYSEKYGEYIGYIG